MKKNIASQSIGVQMITAADGTVFTGAVAVAVTVDNGTQATGTATAPVHEGNGYHSYRPSQAETNGDHVAFTFTGTGAIAATVQVFTQFPQTGDNFARLGAPAGASVSADVAAVKADSAAVLVDTGTTLPGTLAGLATQASVDTIDGNVDAVLVDTGTTLPARFTGIEGATFSTGTDSLEAIRDRGDAAWTTGAGGSSPTVEQIRIEMDSNSTQLSGIIADTGTTLPAALAGLATQSSVDTIDTNVDAVLVDTGTTLPAQVSALNNISAADVNAQVLDVLVTDTFTEVTVPAATASLKDMIHYTFSKAKNKITQTSTTFALRNDADNGNLGTATVSDDGTTTIKGEDA
jgi:hypothetical protein